MRVYLAEDSAILRDGLLALLERRGFTANGFNDAGALLAAINANDDDASLPEVVISDIRMPPSFTDEGLRAAEALRAAHPNLPVLLFSQYVEAAYATRLLATGAAGVQLANRSQHL